MTLLLDLGLVLLGTVLLIFAAKYLLEGLIGVSAAFAVPTFILAMLVISIDLEVFAPAVVGSYQDFTALSYGSILGTVVFLIGLALGTAAAIYPITRVDFPPRYVVLLGAALVSNLLFAFDGTIQTWEGLLSIALYVAYLVYLIVDLGRTRAAPTEITEAEGEVAEVRGKPLPVYLLWIGAGLLALVGGGIIVVQGVSGLLQVWGITETIMGVTVLAIAANSVELVEAVIPAQRGLSEVVIGNVIGSAIFQILFTTGVAALIRPLQVEPVALNLLAPAVLLSWGLLAVVVLRKRLRRVEGIGLIVLYLGFVAVSLTIGMRY